MLEGDYPYVAYMSGCKYNSSKGKFKVTGYQYITQNSVVAHKTALQNGPVAIALDAANYAFQLYSGGIISGTSCGTTMDHSITLVGYGHDSTLNMDYWVAKNQWGSYWGESGYVRIQRNDAGTNSGVCGLLQHSVQPTGISI